VVAVAVAVAVAVVVVVMVAVLMEVAEELSGVKLTNIVSGSRVAVLFTHQMVTEMRGAPRGDL